MIFLDEALLHVRGGRGGNGCVAFRREKFVPRGGPSGGDGGHGGSVVLVGDEGVNTLYHLRFRQLHAAERGKHGEGSNRTGRSAPDLVIPVPLGTVVRVAEDEAVLGEVLEHGEKLTVAEGGRGGRGNARFATSTNQAPRRCEPGFEGEEGHLRLELKLLADVGIVGLPNAGKSTLIRAISAARPKVADYPFTTLVPQLGVVSTGVDRQPFVVADLPGLIEGASEGAGLGFQFLRHVERCRVLLHLVDLSAEAEEGHSPVADMERIERELESFDPGLLERERIVVGSKLDAADAERGSELADAARQRDLPYLAVSSVTHAGLAELVARLADELDAAAAETPVTTGEELP